MPRPTSYSPLTFLLAAIPVSTFGLGVWQISRLRDKKQFILDTSDRLRCEPITISSSDQRTVEALQKYTRILQWGRFVRTEMQIRVPRTFNGQPGFKVIAPFEPCDDPESSQSESLGAVHSLNSEPEISSTKHNSATSTPTRILVDRGWVPTAQSPNVSTPDHPVLLSGYTASTETRPSFNWGISTDPVETDGVFVYPSLDIARIAEYVGALKCCVQSLRGEDEDVSAAIRDGVPVGRSKEIEIRNQHISYIFTWSLIHSHFFVILKSFPADTPNSMILYT